MKIRIYVLIVFLFLGLLLIAWWFFSFDFGTRKTSAVTGQGTFTSGKKLPEARTEAGGISMGDNMYVFGGINAYGGTLRTGFAYAADKQEWRAVRDLPEPINHPGVVHDNENIYVIGGFKPLSIRIRGFMFADWNPLNTLYRYSPSEDKWTKLSPMPEPRGAGGVCIVNDTIWYVGGINQDKNISNSLFGYAIKAGKWFVSTPMQFARDHLRAEAVDGRIYAISGRKDDLRFNLSYVEEFTPETKTWKRMADIPVGRGGFGSSVHEGKIYTYGGEHTWTTFENFEVYDPKANVWKTLEPLPESRHGIVSGWIGDQLHLVSGGRHPRLSISTIHRVFTVRNNGGL